MRRTILTIPLLLILLFSFSSIANAENPQYRNVGLIHNLEIGYKYPLTSETKIIYENLGVRKLNATHPLEMTYSIGYRFNNWVSLSIGSGLSYELINLRGYGDKIASTYVGTGKYANFDIPLFIDLDIYLSTKKSQPMVSLKGGMYVLNSTMALLEGGFGWNFRLNQRCNLYVMASASMYPSVNGKSGETPTMGRAASFAPGLKVGFTL